MTIQIGTAALVAGIEADHESRSIDHRQHSLVGCRRIGALLYGFLRRWVNGIARILGHALMRIVWLGLLAALGWSPSFAADQQAEAKALGTLFSNQSSAEFPHVDWRQKINISINGCDFILRNEQHLPDQSARKPYVETNIFNLTIIKTESDKVLKRPNKTTTYLKWHTTSDEFKTMLQSRLRLIEAGRLARQQLDRSDNRRKTDRERLQALADMSERLWADALAGPEGQFLRANHTMQEAINRTRDPRRTYAPFVGFSLHVKPSDVDELICALDRYKRSWCST